MSFSSRASLDESDDYDSTVWVYLFFLPFQLVSQFGYYAIPGVAIAAFIYLGFIAAGEEIEQPFGEWYFFIVGIILNNELYLLRLGYDDVRFPHWLALTARNFADMIFLQNDLDLDLFCHDIIRVDIKQLKASPCLNAYFDPKYKYTEAAPRPSFAVSELSHLPGNYYEANSSS